MSLCRWIDPCAGPRLILCRERYCPHSPAPAGRGSSVRMPAPALSWHFSIRCGWGVFLPCPCTGGSCRAAWGTLTTCDIILLQGSLDQSTSTLRISFTGVIRDPGLSAGGCGSQPCHWSHHCSRWTSWWEGSRWPRNYHSPAGALWHRVNRPARSFPSPAAAKSARSVECASAALLRQPCSGQESAASPTCGCSRCPSVSPNIKTIALWQSQC